MDAALDIWEGKEGSLRTEENREPVSKTIETSFLVADQASVCIRENGIARNAYLRGVTHVYPDR